MTRNYKTGLIYVLIVVYLLVVAVFLTLAIDQAINLISLYRVSASPSATTDLRNLWRLSLSLSNDTLITAIVAVILFGLVSRHPRRLLPVSIIAALIFITLNLYSGRHILPQVLIWPTPPSLSEQYIQVLAANDLEAALKFTDQSDECHTIMAQVFQDHRALLEQQLGGDEPKLALQDISVKKTTTFYSKPVPQGFIIMQPVPKQLTTIAARWENGETTWLNLKMSYQPFLGTRYICGQDIESSM